MFSWTPIHQEATRKMLAISEPEKELLATLTEMKQQGLKVIGLKDQNPKGSSHPLERIDPASPRRVTGDGQSESHPKGRWSPSLITLDTPLLEPVRSERLPDFAPAYTSTPE